jgi:hypothetical protein
MRGADFWINEEVSDGDGATTAAGLAARIGSGRGTSTTEDSERVRGSGGGTAA